MDSIDFGQDTGFYLNGRRCDFTKEVQDSFPHRDGMDLCHGISFHCMAQGLVNAINFYNYYIRQPDREPSDTRAWTLRFITGMIISVKRMKMNEQEIQDFIVNGIKSDTGNLLNDYRSHLRKLMCSMEWLDQTQQVEDWVVEVHMHHCTYYINHILDLLYNEKENLDYGYSVWNRSLQDAFDPYEVQFNAAENTFLLESEQDGVAVTNLLAYTLGKSDELDNTENGLFFYTASNENEGTLYSSRNDPAIFQPATAVQPNTFQICYKNYLTGAIEAIPMI
ncbi:hypothetical protein [Anaerostipes sp.]|uniref:hypothetical protein n=1 Tax=Anaerostipes sp. TaxID=1872530 RepID=UPI0025BD9760|nr:hypothetical protein [Anaerostipes sp.]MBS7009894.1 hypothetical protein [Anaerostipes sp.]